jgi:8-oxo-dGTP diphosphatase
MAKVISDTIGIIDDLEISEIQWVDLKTANELMPYYPEGVEGLLSSSAPYNFQI